MLSEQKPKDTIRVLSRQAAKEFLFAMVISLKILIQLRILRFYLLQSLPLSLRKLFLSQRENFKTPCLIIFKIENFNFRRKACLPYSFLLFFSFGCVILIACCFCRFSYHVFCISPYLLLYYNIFEFFSI